MAVSDSGVGFGYPHLCLSKCSRKAACNSEGNGRPRQVPLDIRRRNSSADSSGRRKFESNLASRLRSRAMRDITAMPSCGPTPPATGGPGRSASAARPATDPPARRPRPRYGYPSSRGASRRAVAPPRRRTRRTRPQDHPAGHLRLPQLRPSCNYARQRRRVASASKAGLDDETVAQAATFPARLGYRPEVMIRQQGDRTAPLSRATAPTAAPPRAYGRSRPVLMTWQTRHEAW